jgi:hypothetical protein
MDELTEPLIAADLPETVAAFLPVQSLLGRHPCLTMIG